MRLTGIRAPAPWLAATREVAIDLMVCLRFYSRLPLRPLPFEPKAWDAGRLGPALRLAPLAGAVIGAIGALGLALFGLVLGLPPWVAATLAIAGLMVSSGALHEDGLADVADGFGGGGDRQRKLAIMRDSRIGAFGASALILSLTLRVGGLAGLIERFGYAGAIAALVAAGAASRGFGLWPLATLGPARADGLTHAAGPVPRPALVCALALATLLGTVPLLLAGLSAARALLACLAALAASIAMTRLAARHVGGHTGDVAGAAQQLSEVGFLLALLLAPRFG